MNFKRTFVSIILNTFLLVALVMAGFTNFSPLKPKASTAQASTDTYLPLITLYRTPSIFGIVASSIDDGGGLSEAVNAKARWGRIGISWQTVQSTENGPYNWDSSIDTQMINAANNNISLVLTLGGTPVWARDPAINKAPPGACDAGGGRINPSYYSEWTSFVQAAISRYSAAPYNLEYVDFYNEPDVYNNLGCWGDYYDPTYFGGKSYGEMLKVTYPVIKAIQPNMNVLVGELLLDCDTYNPPAGKDCSSGNFLKGILAANAGPYFDGISFHGYDFYQKEIGLYSNPNFSADNTTGPVVINKANFIRKVLAAYNVTGKFLISSESSLVCRELCNNFPQYFPGFQIAKAYYVAQAYASAIANNFRANMWYQEINDSWNVGLLNTDRTPLPAYYAYQFTSDKMGYAVFNLQINSTPGLRIYVYTEANGATLWVMWSLDQKTHSIQLPSLPGSVTLIGTDGKASPQTVTQSLTVGIPPVFVEWTK